MSEWRYECFQFWEHCAIAAMREMLVASPEESEPWMVAAREGQTDEDWEKGYADLAKHASLVADAMARERERRTAEDLAT